MSVALELSLSGYEAQLEQVQNARLVDQSNEDLQQLEQDLKQLIQLTKENLLQEKKKEMLAQLNQDYHLSDDEEEEEETKKEEPPPQNDDDDDDEEDQSFNELEGKKCQAPFTSTSGHRAFHNGIIFQVEKGEHAQSIQDIKLRIVFSHPIETKMVSCPFYLDGRCRFGDDKCKYSHGAQVNLSDIKEYREPDFGSLAKGRSVLAKDLDEMLWHHAKIESLEDENTKVYVKFNHNSKEVKVLPIENILPLENSGDNEYDSDLDDTIDADNDEVFVPESIIDRLSTSVLGEWEQHTKGFGSKLMMKMGYVVGMGLGKDGEGRVDPVTAYVYPSGKSLDWCMEKRLSAGGGDALSVERTLKKQQAKEEAKFAKRQQNEKKNTSVFDFINSKIGYGQKSKHDLSKVGNHSKNEKKQVKDISCDKLKVHNFKISEDIAKTEKEVDKLKSMLRKYVNTDPSVANGIRAKLKDKEQFLNQLRMKEKSINREQDKRKGNKKLSIF